jgi:zinc D-Ala-D-Ala dipeptidase
MSRRNLTLCLATLPLTTCIAPRPDADVPFLRKPTFPKTGKVAPGDLVELIKLDPSIRLDMRYATPNNFTGRTLYKEPRAFLTRIASDALLTAHRKLRDEGFGVMIFDAYRPWRVTKALWDATPLGPKKNYVANPKRGSRHNRGCAVDLTLYDLKTGRAVEMPSEFDDFSARAHREYDDDSPAARRHAKLLEMAMEAEGFVGMSNEWWHFDFKDWAQFPVLDIPFSDLG